VLPALPGAVVAPPVVPPVDGVFPELPGVVVDPPVVPPVDGVLPVEGAAVGTLTTAAFTGVVAKVTKVAAFRIAAGVGLGFEAVLEDAALEDRPEEFSVHCAAHVIAADPIVTDTPTPTVAPLLQLQPAKVNPDLESPEPLPVVKVAPAASAD
jgi:hypothetical protein